MSRVESCVDTMQYFKDEAVKLSCTALEVIIIILYSIRNYYVYHPKIWLTLKSGCTCLWSEHNVIHPEKKVSG